MSSGVGVHSDCGTAYNDIKLGHKYRYVMYRLSTDLKQIEVCTKAPPSAEYNDFKAELMEAEGQGQCRYAVYDAEYENKDGQKRNKLLFFCWSPDSVTIKQKMVYSSSKDALKKTFQGIGKEIQANDESDLAWSNILEVLRAI